MGDCTLPPEARLELRVQLDRLRAAQQRCFDGLRCLSDGTLSKDDYVKVLRQQRDAQSDWERKSRRYLLIREV
jgi:hypothetical protein